MNSEKLLPDKIWVLRWPEEWHSTWYIIFTPKIQNIVEVVSDCIADVLIEDFENTIDWEVEFEKKEFQKFTKQYTNQWENPNDRFFPKDENSDSDYISFEAWRDEHIRELGLEKLWKELIQELDDSYCLEKYYTVDVISIEKHPTEFREQLSRLKKDIPIHQNDDEIDHLYDDLSEIAEN